MTVKQQAAAAVAEREAMSATKIQSTQRGRIMRRDFLKQKKDLDLSAAKDKEQREQTHAAVRIQAIQRGNQTRRHQAQAAGVDTDNPDLENDSEIEVGESGEEYETVEVYADDDDDYE